MKSRMAGVALAAVVSACALAGGVQRAEAFAISGTFNGFLTADPDRKVSETFTFSGDGASQGILYPGTFSIMIGEVPFRSGRTSFLFESYLQNGFDLVQRSVFYVFPLSNGLVNFGFRTKRALDPSQNEYSLTASDFNSFYAYLVKDGYREQEVTLTEISLQGLVPTNRVLNEIPLPPAAPLFGTALLALGGLAFARRRGAVAQL